VERLPRTSIGRQRGFLHLLTRVDPHAPDGLQFSFSQLLTPGAIFDPASLPRPAVILEWAGSVRSSSDRRRGACRDLYILWQFNFDSLEWEEVIRVLGRADCLWTREVALLAHRLLSPTEPPPAAEQAQHVISEISGAIAARLDHVSRDVRCYVLAALDEYLAAEIVDVMRDLTVFRAGSGPGAYYPRLGAHRDAADPWTRRARSED
jgi:hypothetical protein